MEQHEERRKEERRGRILEIFGIDILGLVMYTAWKLLME
jgi:hypothetical protein